MTRAERRIARPTIHFAYARFHGAPCSGRVRCMRSWIVTTVAAGGRTGTT